MNKKFPRSGIVVITSRSGFIKAEYYDVDNDFESLTSVLMHTYEYYRKEGLAEISSIEYLPVIELYTKLTEFTKLHDVGSFVIVENKI